MKASDLICQPNSSAFYVNVTLGVTLSVPLSVPDSLVEGELSIAVTRYEY